LLLDSLNILNSEIIKVKSRNTTYIIVIVIVSFIVALIYAVLNSSNISNPIINLSNAVEEIAKGNFNAEIKGDYIRRDDEIGRLSLSLQRVVASMKLAILRIGLSKEELGFGFKQPVSSKTVILGGLKGSNKKSQIKSLSDEDLSKMLKEIFANNLGPLGIKFYNRLPTIKDKKILIDFINSLKTKGILEEDDFQKFKQEILDLPIAEKIKSNKDNSDEKP
jgi:HAMP domain-containing protein